MAFPWSSFHLPRPWSRRNANKHSDDDVSGGSPILPNDDGRSMVDDHFGTELDGDEYYRQTPANRRAALQRVSDQLLLAWAQECPELNAEIQMIDERIHALGAGTHHSDRRDDVSVPVRDDHDDYKMMGAAASVRQRRESGGLDVPQPGVPPVSRYLEEHGGLDVPQHGGQDVSRYGGSFDFQCSGPDSRYGNPAVSRFSDGGVMWYRDPAVSRCSEPAVSRYGGPVDQWYGWPPVSHNDYPPALPNDDPHDFQYSDSAVSRYRDPAVSRYDSPTDPWYVPQGDDPCAPQYGESPALQHGDPCIPQVGGYAASQYSGPGLARDGATTAPGPLRGNMQRRGPNFQPCSSSVTAATTTFTMGRPVMSTHVHNIIPPVSGAGMEMVEESSLHGRIWIPTNHSTPFGPPSGGREEGSGVRHVKDAQRSTPSWVLVSEDRPRPRVNHPQGRTNWTGDVPIDRNVMPDAGAVMSDNEVMTRGEAQTLFQQMFQAGVQWAEKRHVQGLCCNGETPCTAKPVWRSNSGIPTETQAQSQLVTRPTPSIARVPQTTAVTGPRDAVNSIATTAASCVSPPSPVVETTRSVSRVKEKKVANYSGKSSWADYLVQFNIAAKLNGWDEDRKAMELATRLEGNARGVLADLTPEQQLDFNVLVSKLTQRFEPEGQLGIHQTQLRNRKRKRNETIPELLQEISRLVRKAYPAADEQTRSYMAVSSFISALGNEAQELFVYQKEPANLDEAGKAALSFETFQAGRSKDVAMVRMQQSENSSSEVPSWARDWISKVERQLNNWRKQSGRGRGAPGWRSSSGTRRPGTCHHCGAEGHWIRECPNRGTSTGPQSPARTENNTTSDGDAAPATSVMPQVTTSGNRV